MDIKSKIRVIEDFPEPGISYKDITTLIKDKEAFTYAVDLMAGAVHAKPDMVAGIEARGFIFASALAYKLGVGFVPLRKAGKLPAETLGCRYNTEYGGDEMQIHTDAITKEIKVIIVDDLIATGGTLKCACELIEGLKGSVKQILTLIELTDFNARSLLSSYDITSFIKYEH